MNNFINIVFPYNTALEDSMVILALHHWLFGWMQRKPSPNLQCALNSSPGDTELCLQHHPKQVLPGPYGSMKSHRDPLQRGIWASSLGCASHKLPGDVDPLGLQIPQWVAGRPLPSQTGLKESWAKETFQVEQPEIHSTLAQLISPPFS